MFVIGVPRRGSPWSTHREALRLQAGADPRGTLAVAQSYNSDTLALRWVAIVGDEVRARKLVNLTETAVIMSSRAERVRNAWLAVTEADLIQALTAAADGMGLDLRVIEDPALERRRDEARRVARAMEKV